MDNPFHSYTMRTRMIFDFTFMFHIRAMDTVSGAFFVRHEAGSSTSRIAYPIDHQLGSFPYFDLYLEERLSCDI